MKVCIVGELNGGVGVYARNLIHGLRGRGVETTIITPHPDALSDAGEIIPVPASNGRARWLPHARRFARALQKVRPACDIVHFTDARYSLFVRQRHQPVVGTMNDYFYTLTGWFQGDGTRDVYHDWISRHLYYNFIRTLEGRALRRLDGVVCIAQAVADRLHQAYRIPTDRLGVIHYGINYGPSDAEPFSKSARTVVFAGGNFQRKGLETLIRASRQVLQKVPDVRFVVLGDSAGAARLKKVAGELGVRDSFAFEGQVDYQTLYRFYSTADVFAMPSVLEAFGLPYLEAMHCGVPVIGTHMPGPDEYLVHEGNALLSAPGDSDALGRDILRLMEDRALCQKLVQGGRATAERFTVALMVNKTVAFYEKAISTRRDGSKTLGNG